MNGGLRMVPQRASVLFRLVAGFLEGLAATVVVVLEVRSKLLVRRMHRLLRLAQVPGLGFVVVTRPSEGLAALLSLLRMCMTTLIPVFRRLA